MKILVVRFSSIGDIVLTFPVLSALKSQVKDVEIHFLTKRNFVQLIEPNPNVSKVYSIDKNVNELSNVLKDEGYDCVVDLHSNLRTKRLKSILKIKTYTFKKLNVLKWLLVRFKVDKMPDKHVVDRYFDAVLPLGVSNSGHAVPFVINPNDVVDVRNKFGFLPGEFFSIAIGAQFRTKQIPTDVLVSVIDRLSLPVVIVGGPMDRNRAEEIIVATNNSNVFNSCGDFKLAQSASIVGQSKKLLTGDTGMMHIAACFDVSIVSVWGSTTPNFGMYPYRPDNTKSFSMHQVDGLECRPCSKIGFKECPKKHHNCMSLQNTNAIVEDMES